MLKIQEFVYGYSNGYNIKKCAGCTLTSSEVSEYNGMGLYIYHDYPCIELFFDSKRHNLVAVFRAKQNGANYYRHVIALKEMETAHYFSGEVLPLFDLGFVSSEDVAEIINGVKPFEPISIQKKELTYEKIIGTNLLTQLVCDVVYSDLINDKNPITVIVSEKVNPMTVMWAVAKQFFASIPCGLLNRFSFSYNSNACKIRFVSKNEQLDTLGKKYDLQVELSEINTKLHPALVRLIRDCVENNAIREFIYSSFEVCYSGEFPKTADYIPFSEAASMLASSAKDIEYFEEANRILSVVGDRFSSEMKERVVSKISDDETFSSILLSKKSSFSSCKTLKELDALLQQHEPILAELRSFGTTIGYALTIRILSSISLPDSLVDLGSEKIMLTSHNSMIRLCLDAQGISDRCDQIDLKVKEIADKYYENFSCNLATAVKRLSIADFDNVCRDAEAQPFYNKEHCSRIIAYILANPNDYADMCEEFYLCALRHANSDYLHDLASYVDGARQVKRIKDSMINYRNYLGWALNAYPDEQTSNEYLSLMFDNGRITDYAGMDVCDLIDASEQLCGQFSFDKRSKEASVLASILSHCDCVLLLNTKKTLSNVFRELLFCKHLGVFQIKALCSDKMIANIDVEESISALQKVLNWETFEIMLNDCEFDTCSVFARHCRLSDDERRIFGFTPLLINKNKEDSATHDYKTKNSSKKLSINAEGDNTFLSCNAEQNMTINKSAFNCENERMKSRFSIDWFKLLIIAAGVIVIIGCAIALILLLTKQSREIRSSGEESAPVVTHSDDPIVDQDVTSTPLIRPSNTPTITNESGSIPNETDNTQDYIMETGSAVTDAYGNYPYNSTEPTINVGGD